MKLRASFIYEAVDNFVDHVVVIRDIGPWDHYATVTNAAETVVEEILKKYPRTKRIFYFDSEGEKGELLFENGRFTGFAPGPKLP